MDVGEALSVRICLSDTVGLSNVKTRLRHQLTTDLAEARLESCQYSLLFNTNAIKYHNFKAGCACNKGAAFKLATCPRTTPDMLHGMT
jgi:hypothetical protein